MHFLQIFHSYDSNKLRKIIINESFFDKKLTGIPRLGYELSKRLLDYEDVYLLTVNNHHIPLNKVLSLKKRNYQYKIVNLYDKQIFINKTDKNDILLHLGSMLPIKMKNMFITICDMSVFDHPEWFKRSFVYQNKLIIPNLVKSAKKIFTISEFSKNRIIKHLNVKEENIIVFPCGVSKRFSPKSDQSILVIKEKYNLPNNYILFLSSLEPRKNLKNLFKAWSRLKKQERGDCSLLITGSKGKVFADTNIKYLVKTTPDIIFTGYFDDQDLPGLYSGAQGFIYPSFYEGFGLPPLEAMACGTPVIVSNTASMPEVIGNSAIFINPYDVKSIMEGIKVIIENNQKRKELAKIGQLHAKNFSWDKSSEIIYQTLKKEL